jgi:hypothetical protein
MGRSDMDTVHTKKPFLGYFDGMNYYAAKSLGTPYPYGKNTVVVKEGMSKQRDDWTRKHEKTEAGLMKKGKSYRQAHAETLLTMGDYKSKEAALRDSDRMIKKAKDFRHRK